MELSNYCVSIKHTHRLTTVIYLVIKAEFSMRAYMVTIFPTLFFVIVIVNKHLWCM